MSVLFYRKMTILKRSDGKETRKYDWIGDFSDEGFAIVFLEGKGYGYINLDLDEICPIKYDEAFSFINGFACVKLNNKYGFIDTNGNEICPIKYENVWAFSKKGIARVDLTDTKSGFINCSGDEICEPKYCLAGNAHGSARNTLIPMHEFNGFNYQGITAILYKNKFGIINDEGHIVVEPQFGIVIIPKNDEGEYIPYSCKVGNDYKMGYLDRYGNIVLAADCFERVTTFKNGFAVVTIDGLDGIIDTDFYNITQTEYDLIDPFMLDGYAFAVKTIQVGPIKVKLKGFINQKGFFSYWIV